MGLTPELMAGQAGLAGWRDAPPSEATAPRPRLYVVDDQGCPIGHDLGRVTTIGRHPDNSIQILDAGMSKFHLRLLRGRAGVLFEDLGSANGTRLNGAPAHRAVLHDGDELQVGETRLLYALHWVAPGGHGPAVSMLPTRLGGPGSAVTHIDGMDAGEEFPAAEHLGSRAQLAETYQRLRQTYALLRAVASADDLNAMADAVLAHAMRQLPVARGALLLLDLVDGVPQLAPLATLAVGEHGHDLSLPRARIEQILRDRTGLVIEDAGQCSITVPLVDGGQVVGLLHFEGAAGAPPPTARDLAILSTVARPAALAIANARLLASTAEDARARQALERFLSPTLVEQVRRRALLLDEDGRSCEATILFADIRGFVSLSAELDAEAVVAMLNEYFERAVEVVFRHHGVLDKFIGDALMAVWGAAQSTPDHAAQALRAAVDLRQALDELNLERTQRGEPALRVGTGVATGRVVAGRVGSSRRLELTVIGDAVNVASRLCDMAGAGEIVVAQSTREAAPEVCSYRDLGERLIKGKPQPVLVSLAAPVDSAGRDRDDRTAR
ncbi:MAG: adenylate/guanylate cyclase domain-containing protein [Pseudomonadota bacterium]